MCGIGGVYFYKETIAIEKYDIRKMLDALKHRGPDAQRIKKMNDRLTFVHTRLSIVDPSEEASQPMVDEIGSVIVYNGEIYNYKEIQNPSITYKTKSDTEVLLKGMIEEKYEFLEKVSGMYALAFWDEQENALIIARDNVGIKPLYYMDDGSKIIFASEIKAIIAIYEEVNLDKDSIDEYFQLGYINTPNTAFSEIKQLGAGEILKYNKHGKQLINKITKIKNKEIEKSYEKTYARLISEEVNKHIAGETLVTILLSGGIDSTTLSMYGKKTNRDIEASFLKQSNGNFDESLKAREVANELGIKLNVFEETKHTLDKLKKIVFYSDDLICDPALMSNFDICRNISKEYKVGISGDGADELFLGYHVHIATLLASNKLFIYLFGSSLNIIRKVLKLFAHKESEYPLKMKLERFLRFYKVQFPLNHLLWRMPVIDTKIFNKQFNFPTERIKEAYKLTGVSKSSEMMRCDMKTYLEGNILKKVDRMSMANSVEMRVPFLSEKMISFAENLPLSQKIGRLGQKHIMKKILKKNLSKKIWKQGKVGFGSRLDEIVESKEIHLYLLDRKQKYFLNIIKQYELKNLLAKKNKSYNEQYQLFSILIFKLWIEGIYENYLQVKN